MRTMSEQLARRAAKLARGKREPLDWFVLVGKSAAWARLNEEADRISGGTPGGRDVE